ncbi:unnamed protein product [Bursaphelenchus okinawaensis]|uniref:Dynactin subunit 6 n=1 Tax=Bursaphelenchus okinawaensis TaxID=465554 RepID=A0A811JSZ8_9BILA|nr:unnamed protein product [Bursaphelenchus okinawaensis]CAG9082311.1 unnamed protein product [Bursaphelenchus okinawaensis]
MSKLEIHESSFVHSDSILKGEIVFGAGTVVHPYAQIDAGPGKIIFGTNNIIEENSQIINKDEGKVIIIGNDNIFEVGSNVQASSIGNNNVFGIRSQVAPNVTVPDGCVLGPKCQVNKNEDLQPNTVIYGEENKRRIASSNVNNSQRPHCDFLQTKLSTYGKSFKNL